MNSIERGRIVLDVWRAKRASRAEIAARQRRRLVKLLSFARRQSRFYKRHYANVPEGSTDLTEFPPVTKQLLMTEFDDVVTDTAITKAEQATPTPGHVRNFGEEEERMGEG